MFFHRILRRIADSFDRRKDKGCKLCVRRRQKFQAATTGIKTAIEIERELEINFKATLVTSIYFV